jgi:hypothetical protein
MACVVKINGPRRVIFKVNAGREITAKENQLEVGWLGGHSVKCGLLHEALRCLYEGHVSIWFAECISSICHVFLVSRLFFWAILGKLQTFAKYSSF